MSEVFDDFSKTVSEKKRKLNLTNKHTDWNLFRNRQNVLNDLKIEIKKVIFPSSRKTPIRDLLKGSRSQEKQD